MSSEDLGGVPEGDNEGGEPANQEENVPVEEKAPAIQGPPLYEDWESLKEGTSDDSLVGVDRDVWTNQVEFIMVCLSTAVGLGNVWRFPFTAYDNGGGAFLIPFLTVLFVLGIPLYFVEMSVGQLCTRGPIGVWEMAPIMRGTGWAFLLIATCTVLYYCAILATCVLYLFYGFASELPWKGCYWDHIHHTSPVYAYENRKIFQHGMTCSKSMGYAEYTLANNETKRISNAELFFTYAVGKQSDNIDHGLGYPDLKLSLGLATVWLLVFINVMLGTKTAGKFSYFTALFPYFVLFILFGRAIVLDGAADGVKYFFQADFSKVFNVDVWFRAVSQVFFSLGVGYGTVTTYGSYNPLRQKVYKDIIFICLADTGTSILAGVTVFSILGVLAKEKGVEVGKVTSGGNGLAFVSYPEILSNFGGTPVPQIFSFLFFMMLLALGIGSGSSYITALCGTLFDRVPLIGNSRKFRVIATFLLCFSFLVFGLIFTTPGGSSMIDFFDNYSSGFVVYAIVIFELGGVAYVYGMKNFVMDLKFMFSTTRCQWIFMVIQIWGYITPVILVVVLGYVLSNVSNSPLKTLDGSVFPLSATISGWALFGVIVLTVPVVGIVVLCTRKSSKMSHKWMASVSPTNKWGPKPPEAKAEWQNLKRGFDGRTSCWKQICGKCCTNEAPGSKAEPEVLMNAESYVTNPASAVSQMGDQQNAVETAAA